MRKRHSNNSLPLSSTAADHDKNINNDGNNSSDEESVNVAHPPQENPLFQSTTLRIETTYNSGITTTTSWNNILDQIKHGKAWWVQCLTIYIAAVLTYSYNNGGDHSTNVQIAIMTVITLVGASPFATTHLICTSIGAFVGGQNIIGSTGTLLEDNIHNQEIYAMNYLLLLVLSWIVGLTWCFVINNSNLNILDGYAGRLGTTTFVGMNITMIIYGFTGIVDWDRYYYGFKHVIHIGEEDSSTRLSDAWDSWSTKTELAIGYVCSVVWLGVVAGGTRILHDNHLKRYITNKSGPPPQPLNNVMVPVLWALLSMLVVNATQYEHSPGLFNGFAVGSYIAMASLRKIPSVSKFASVSILAALWGLLLTPFFVGFAGKSGFTSMLGHVTHTALETVLRGMICKRRQLQQQLEIQEQQQAFEPSAAAATASTNDGNTQQLQKEDVAPSSPHRHKPKKETFYSKQQRRQEKRLKQHLHDDNDPPQLHHRAWSALPVDGDGVWQHSLEPRQHSVV